MTDATTTTTKRGRPATGHARTPAQRSADLRARARTQVFEGSPTPISEVAASVLLEGIGAAYRARLPFEIERIAHELLRRLGHAKAVSVTTIPVAVTTIPVAVTTIPVTATDNPGPPPSEGAVIAQTRYPVAVKRLAVQMQREGADAAAILEAIERATGGKAPDPSNVLATLRRWAKAVGDTAG